MSKNLENKYFIILNKDEIIFSCLNYENKISFTKKYILLNSSTNIFDDLEKFLKKDLIIIEKNLKAFVRNIFLIIDIDQSLSVDLSIKYNFEIKKINGQRTNDLLNILKYQFIKSSEDYEIIHMIISKFLIDGEEKDLTFSNKKFKDLILEVRLECLKVQIVRNFKKIFSDYEILVEKILLADYLREYINDTSNNIIFVANKILNGENIKEVMWAKKKTMNKGFFEKFFNFFN